MVIFVLMSAKIKPHVRIFTFSLSYFGKWEHISSPSKMREMSQKMRETVNKITKNEKREIPFGACHHNIKTIWHVASEFDSIFNLSPTSCRCLTFNQWLCWCTFVSHHGGRIELKQHLCMSMSSFDKLLSYIRQSLKVDSDMAWLHGGEIIPGILLYCMLHYLAGGSYTDIFFLVGISSASFYQVIWKTMYAIVQCEEL